nr:VOC family protein [Lysobacter tabacisoli]
MVQQIFVNLPVHDLPRAKAFFAALGFAFNPQFTNDSGACLVLGDNIFAMLLTREFFATFIDRPVADTRAQAAVIVCVAVESRERVDDLFARALAAGATPGRPPQDHGFMYQHGFEDLDGHLWELVHLSGAPS